MRLTDVIRHKIIDKSSISSLSDKDRISLNEIFEFIIANRIKLRIENTIFALFDSEEAVLSVLNKKFKEAPRLLSIFWRMQPVCTELRRHGYHMVFYQPENQHDIPEIIRSETKIVLKSLNRLATCIMMLQGISLIILIAGLVILMKHGHTMDLPYLYRYVSGFTSQLSQHFFVTIGNISLSAQSAVEGFHTVFPRLFKSFIRS